MNAMSEIKATLNIRQWIMVTLWKTLTEDQRSVFAAAVLLQPPIRRTKGDRFGSVTAAVNPEDYDLTKAEGRKDFDDALRAAITRFCGTDKKLRRHVGDMVAEWRRPILQQNSRTKPDARVGGQDRQDSAPPPQSDRDTDDIPF